MKFTIPFSSLIFVLLFLEGLTTDVKRFDELYADGIEAYWNENWEGCIHYLGESLKSYRFMQQGIKNCSIKCNKVVTDASQHLASIEYIINKAVCLEKCNKEVFGQSNLFTRISHETLDLFKHKKPYVYLQFAYFRNGDYAKSLAATYTYSQYDSDDPMMKTNMDYFLENDNSTKEMFVNQELAPQIDAYDSGIEAFNREDYKDAASYFEDALLKYLDAEITCRGMCEGEHNFGTDYPDKPTPFYKQIVGHYKDVLECYMSCPTEAARVSRKSILRNHLPNHYQFLHLAYYGLNDMKKAAECAKSYLLFFPQSKIFEERLNHIKDWKTTQPREEAINFHHKLELQVALLKYIYENFGIRDYDVDILKIYQSEDYDNIGTDDDTIKVDAQEEKVADDETEGMSPEMTFQEDEEEEEGYSSISAKQKDIISSNDQQNERMETLKQKRIEERDILRHKGDVDISHLPFRQTIDSKFLIDVVDGSSLSSPPIPEGPVLFQSTLLANSTQLAGPLRFAVDDFANEDECHQLIDLELTGGLSGDGYKGNTSPHTKHELFHGITVHRAAQLAQTGHVTVRAARIYYDISERIRQQVKAYFKLGKELYFDYTHLVCRTALNYNAGHGPRTDNSHPVHGDNCNLHDDGSCHKAAPAYTWRDYSSIMYLNSDFEGGRFFMTDGTGKRVIMQMAPKCGRMVAFCAGGDCLHGVKPVVKGRRCAIALWFTLDPSYDEQSRIEAKRILDSISSKEEL